MSLDEMLKRFEQERSTLYVLCKQFIEWEDLQRTNTEGIDFSQSLMDQIRNMKEEIIKIEEEDRDMLKASDVVKDLPPPKNFGPQ